MLVGTLQRQTNKQTWSEQTFKAGAREQEPSRYLTRKQKHYPSTSINNQFYIHLIMAQLYFSDRLCCSNQQQTQGVLPHTDWTQEHAGNYTLTIDDGWAKIFMLEETEYFTF